MGDTDVAVPVSRVAIHVTVALLGVLAGRAAGWLLGAALFVLSRTTGLPGF